MNNPPYAGHGRMPVGGKTDSIIWGILILDDGRLMIDWVADGDVDTATPTPLSVFQHIWLWPAEPVQFHVLLTQEQPMKKFQVLLRETVEYTVVVEAEDSDAAEEIAADKWAESETPTADFDGIGHGVEVWSVDQIDA